MKPFLFTTAAVLGLILLGSVSDAQAGSSFGIYFGTSPGYYGGHGHSYGNYDCYRPQPRHHGHYDWHDTSHYDYRPGGYVPHGNHYHYVPGQYQWHNTGHWDYHHQGHYHHLR